MARSRTRFLELQSLFESHSSLDLRAGIARIIVLYEDLRIEIEGIAAKSLGPLDTTSESYRMQYFLRRSIASLVEFAESIRMLHSCPDFHLVRSCFDNKAVTHWDTAVEYFKTAEGFLKQVRNDIGGHFGHSASRYPIANLVSGALGKFEVVEMASGAADIRLHFAGELAATAMFRHLRGNSQKEKMDGLVNIVDTSYGHAAKCAADIAHCYFWKKS